MFEITETAVIGNHDLARGGSRRAEVLKDLRTNKRFAFVAVLEARLALATRCCSVIDWLNIQEDG